MDDAQRVLSDLDEGELEGASEDSKQTWRLVEILLEHMSGRAIPFEDRATIIDKWRRVLVVAQEGGCRAILSCRLIPLLIV